MRAELTAAALRDYIDAEPAVQRAFDKQTRLLLENLRHPSLRSKKYDEARDIWQARVNRYSCIYFSCGRRHRPDFEPDSPSEMTGTVHDLLLFHILQVIKSTVRP